MSKLKTEAIALKDRWIASSGGGYLDTLAKFLRFEVTEADIHKAWEEVDRKTRPAHVPQFAYVNGEAVAVPEDLVSEYNQFILDADGKRQTGNILPEDFTGGGEGDYSPVLPFVELVIFLPRVAMVFAMMFAALTSHWIAVLFLLVFVVGHIHYEMPMSIGAGGIMSTIMGLVFCAMGYFTWSEPTWIQMSTWPLFFAFLALFSQSHQRDTQTRKDMLIEQDIHLKRTGPLTKFLLSWKFVVESAQDAANNAAADKSKLLHMGIKGTGLMAAVGSYSSPDAEQEMLLSARDSSPGIICFGVSGTGKTTSFLNPLKRSIFTGEEQGNERIGVLELDNKGANQQESALMLGERYQFISPRDFLYFKNGKENLIKASLFAPIHGMHGEEVAELYGSALSGDDAKSDVWSQAAVTMASWKFIILEYAVQAHKDGILDIKQAEKDCGPFLPGELEWTMSNTFNVLCNDDLARKIALAIPNSLWESSAHLRKAGDYMTRVYKDMAPVTKSGILFNVSSWHAKVTTKREMDLWLDATGEEPGCAHIENSLKGAWQGLYCPATRYGDAGALVAKLAKARLYRAVELRSDNWSNDPEATFCMLLWDEAGVGIGNGIAESNILPVCRSRGLTIVMCSQTIDEYEQRMGREKATAMLANMVNFVSFNSSPRTLEWAAERMGHIMRIEPCKADEVPCGIDYYGILTAIEQTRAAHEGDNFMYDQEALENQAATNQGGLSVFNPFGRTKVDGYGRPLQEKEFKSVAERWTRRRYVPAKVTLRPGLAFNMETDAIYLKTKNVALACFKRGGSLRMDIVRTTPYYTSNIYAARPANDKDVDQAA